MRRPYTLTTRMCCVSGGKLHRLSRERHTFIRRAIENNQVKVVRFSQIVGHYDFFLEVKDGYAGPFKVGTRFVFSRLELVEYR
jgi:hypothetical protein